MKAMVEQKGCIQCGLCASLCPEVFTLEPGLPAQAITDDVPEECKIAVQNAADGCPVSVIHITE
jgi:ferredoxin